MKISKKDYLYRLISAGAKQGGLIVSAAIAATLLDIPTYAQYGYILTIFSVALMLADFGLSVSITKYLAYNPSEKRLSRIAFNSYLAAIGFLILTVVILFILKYTNILVISLNLLLLLIVSIIFALLTSVIEGILRGLKRFKESAIGMSITTLLFFPLQYILMDKWGIEGGLLAQAIYWIIAFIATVYIAKLPFKINYSKKTILKIISYGAQFGIASLSYFLFSRYVILVLGRAQEWNSIAIYDLFARFMILFTFPFTIYGQVISPKYSKKEIIEDTKFILSSTYKMTIYLTLFATLVSAVFYGSVTLLARFIPDYVSLPEFISILNVSTALLFIFTWSNLVDTGILVPTGYAHIMAILYPIIGGISVVILPLSLKYGGYQEIFFTVVALQVAMAILTRGIFVYSLRRKLLSKNL